jgi:hypothetical protein
MTGNVSVRCRTPDCTNWCMMGETKCKECRETCAECNLRTVPKEGDICTHCEFEIKYGDERYEGEQEREEDEMCGMS